MDESGGSRCDRCWQLDHPTGLGERGGLSGASADAAPKAEWASVCGGPKRQPRSWQRQFLFTVMTFSNAVLTRHFLKIFIEIPKA